MMKEVFILTGFSSSAEGRAEASSYDLLVITDALSKRRKSSLQEPNVTTAD